MSDLLGIEQLAELLGTSANSVRNWRTISYGPKSARIGRWVVYRRAEVPFVSIVSNILGIRKRLVRIE